MEVFGSDESSKGFGHDFEEDKWEECDEEEMGPEEAKEFRGVTARMNFLSQDSPNLQYLVTQSGSVAEGEEDGKIPGELAGSTLEI